MDLNVVLLLSLALIVGLAAGALCMWQILRARLAAHAANDTAATERSRAELTSAKSEVALAREQAADARAEAADSRGLVAEARTQLAQTREEATQQIARADERAANARQEASAARAEAAEIESRLAAALAERDAATEQAKALAADRQSLVDQFKVLSGETLDVQGKRADKAADDRLAKTEQLITPLTDLMIRFSDRLAAVEKDRHAMAAELRNQVQVVQNTGEHLRNETRALSTALRKPQIRGAWGELQLRRIAEYAGMVDRCDFEEQATTTTAQDRTIRPDMKVNLSQGKYVYVDSKVPLSAFLDAYETDDERVRAEKLALFGKNVRSHIDQLSSKQYWRAGSATPEFVVMFLPNEQFLFTALEQLPDLQEYAARKDVVLATPNTLIAMLRSIAYGWKQAALAESAKEVFELGRELYDRLATMGKHLNKTGRALNSAVVAYNSTVASMESRVLVTARKFRDYQVVDADLEELKGAETEARSITAFELVEDATQVPPMIGRSSENLPEHEHLVRSEPDLEDMLDAEAPRQRRRTS